MNMNMNMNMNMAMNLNLEQKNKCIMEIDDINEKNQLMSTQE